MVSFFIDLGLQNNFSQKYTKKSEQQKLFTFFILSLWYLHVLQMTNWDDCLCFVWEIALLSFLPIVSCFHRFPIWYLWIHIAFLWNHVAFRCCGWLWRWLSALYLSSHHCLAETVLEDAWLCHGRVCVDNREGIPVAIMSMYVSCKGWSSYCCHCACLHKYPVAVVCVGEPWEERSTPWWLSRSCHSLFYEILPQLLVLICIAQHIY